MPEPVRLINDPVLRELCRKVDDADWPAMEELLRSMHETMLAENGIGLAANQIGRTLRVFILKDGDSYREFINPAYTQPNEDLVAFEGEACLSIPGTSATTQRYNKIRLEWTDKNGNRFEENFEGHKAFAIQHEMDHLRGDLYIDQFKPMRRSMILSKHKKYLLSQRRS